MVQLGKVALKRDLSGIGDSTHKIVLEHIREAGNVWFVVCSARKS